MIFKVLTKEEYEKYLVASPMNNFLQSPKMDEIALSKKQKVHYVGVCENDTIIAGARLLESNSHFGRKYFYSPRGLILDYHNKELLSFFTKNLKKYIKKQKGFVLEIDPLVVHLERDIDGNVVPNGENNEDIVKNLKSLGYKHKGYTKGFDMAKQMRWVFVLDLKDKTSEQVFKEMKQNAKRLITKCEKNGIYVHEASLEELPDYKKILESSAARKNFNDKSLEYYQEMYKAFTPTNEIKFLIARLNVKEYLEKLNNTTTEQIKEITRLSQNLNDRNKSLIDQLNQSLEKTKLEISEAEDIIKNDGEIIDLSAAMFMTYGDEVIYVFGGNIDKYMHFNAQYMIQWNMIKYGIENGFKRYNFFGITGIFSENDPEYGVYDFKKRFNGYVEEYIGEFALPTSWYYKINKIIHKIKK